MWGGLSEQLIAQEVLVEQHKSSAATAAVALVQEEVPGAVTEITSSTLSRTRTGTVEKLELPQALDTSADPTFNSINTVDDAATRSNLGLGTMATANKIGAVADLALTVSNPPTQAEVQAIANKVDALLAAARAANHLT